MNRFWKRSFAIIYLVAIILYISQGILFEGTWFTFLSGVYLLGFGVLISIIILLKQKKHPRILEILMFFIVWSVLLWLISPKTVVLMGDSISTSTMIFYIIIICSSVSVFYYFTIERLISDTVLKLFVFTIGSIFVYNILHFDVALQEGGEYNFSSANNLSYSIAALFPLLLLFWDKKLLMLSLMSASMIFVVFLLKRGSMLCVASCLVTVMFFLFKEIDSKKSSRLFKIGTRGLIFLLLGVVIYSLFVIYQENTLIQARFDADSSGRDSIYSQTLNVWASSELFYEILGHGPLSTVFLIKNYAHNDWLQVLTDFGIIGLLLYVSIPLSIISFYRNHCLDYQTKSSLIVCFFYIILRSSFSMCIYELESVLVFGFLGYTLGRNKILMNNLLNK